MFDWKSKVSVRFSYNFATSNKKEALPSKAHPKSHVPVTRDATALYNLQQIDFISHVITAPLPGSLILTGYY
jgi:hypothetical protein